MKKFLSLYIIFFIFSVSVTAQRKKSDAVFIENLKELNSRPLKVVLKKGNSESTKLFNANYKEAVLSEWKITSDIEFITEKQYKAQKKSKTSKFAYLYLGRIKVGGSRPGNRNDVMVSSYDALQYLALNGKKEIIVTNTSFDFKKKDHKARYFEAIQGLYYVILDEIDPVNSKKDDIFEIYKNGTKQELKDYAIKMAIEGKEDLKIKTLLIDRKQLKKNVDKLIGKYYPYEFKIVSEKTINNAIVANDSTKVLLDKNKITDVETGKEVLGFFFNLDEIKKTAFLPIFSSNKITEQDLIKLNSYLK